MKLVFDTNVLIAALIANGVCADLLEHCVLRHAIVGSEVIFAELKGHLIGKFGFTEEHANEAVVLLRSQMEVVTPQRLEQQVCRDSDDDWILATAIAGNVDCIVTGDNDLLVIGAFEGIDIINPSDFEEFEATRR